MPVFRCPMREDSEVVSPSKTSVERFKFIVNVKSNHCNNNKTSAHCFDADILSLELHNRTDCLAETKTAAGLKVRSFSGELSVKQRHDKESQTWLSISCPSPPLVSCLLALFIQDTARGLITHSLALNPFFPTSLNFHFTAYSDTVNYVSYN